MDCIYLQEYLLPQRKLLDAATKMGLITFHFKWRHDSDHLGDFAMFSKIRAKHIYYVQCVLTLSKDAGVTENSKD